MTERERKVQETREVICDLLPNLKLYQTLSEQIQAFPFGLKTVIESAVKMIAHKYGIKETEFESIIIIYIQKLDEQQISDVVEKFLDFAECIYDIWYPDVDDDREKEASAARSAED